MKAARPHPLVAAAAVLLKVPVLKPLCHARDSNSGPQNCHKITVLNCTAPFQKLQPKVTPLFFLRFFLFKEKKVSLFTLLCRGPLRTLEAEVLLILDASIIALQKPSRNGKASEKAESPSKAQQAELMPAVKRPDSNVDDPTIVRERAGLQTGTNKTGGLTGNTGGLTNGRGEGDRPEVDEASNLGQATNLMDTHPDQGSTAKQEANGPKEGVPDKIRDKVSSSSREQIPADPLSTPAELGRSPGKTNHEKHHKHRFFSRHHVSKKVEPLPFDEEVFQHPIPVTGDDVSRLGAVSVQTVLREFEHR